MKSKQYCFYANQIIHYILKVRNKVIIVLLSQLEKKILDIPSRQTSH